MQRVPACPNSADNTSIHRFPLRRGWGVLCPEPAEPTRQQMRQRKEVVNRTDTSTEEHRRECEARWVLAQPFGARKPYLELVQRQRGEVGRRDLEAEILKQHKAIKAAAAGKTKARSV
ncbi:DUF7696 family protein [Bordetella genomosp. 10]|uniref:DUF7696 family protein n=1 Tax=Bordetella genomosp. 10 TaxID=1416804 RepID=UPI004039EF98